MFNRKKFAADHVLFTCPKHTEFSPGKDSSFKAGLTGDPLPRAFFPGQEWDNELFRDFAERAAANTFGFPFSSKTGWSAYGLSLIHI